MNARRRSLQRSLVLGGLLSSAALLAIAPAFMPASYRWLEHTTSESAAQGVTHAWVARLGFVLFGGSVLLLTWLARERWPPAGRVLHAAFGLLMLGAALFSHRPWEDDVPWDETHDLLHSVAATGLGFAFAFGVVVVGLCRARRSGRASALDWLALGASVVLPLGMSLLPSIAGLLQRLMFLVSYLWYTSVTLRQADEPC